MDMLMPTIAVALLLTGLVVRGRAYRSAPRGRPFWRVRHMFRSQAEYVAYVAGTFSIVLGASLLALSSLVKIL